MQHKKIAYAAELRSRPSLGFWRKPDGDVLNREAGIPAYPAFAFMSWNIHMYICTCGWGFGRWGELAGDI